MGVAAYHVGRKSGGERRTGSTETERSAAMADVEYHATGTRRDDLVVDAAVAMHWGVGKRSIAVRQDVAGPQPRQHLDARWRRKVEMRHHRQFEFVGGIDREVERRHA